MKLTSVAKLFSAVLLALLFFASCKKEEVTPKPNSLIGKWHLKTIEYDNIYDFDTSNYYIEFNANGFEDYNPFSNEVIKGKFTKFNNQLTLSVVPKDIEIEIDSTINTIDNDGFHSIDFYAQNEHIARLDKGLLQPIAKDQTLIINTLTDSTLRINTIDEAYALNYSKLLTNQPNFSFSEKIYRGLIGMLVLVALCFLFSTNRRKVNWALVGKGLLLQLILAILIIKFEPVVLVFDFLAKGFKTVIDFTNSGVEFLFAQFGVGKMSSSIVNFAFTILPTIVFFSALTSLFFYWGILQKIIYGFAWIMKKTLKLSGGESLAAAGNVFLGQTESALLVKPYLGKMTKAEIMSLMTGGMATIAGGVLASYVSFLGGGDPVAEVEFAKHLMTASIISAPAAIVAAKILVPEVAKPNENFNINNQSIGVNAFEAIANGTTDGVKLAVNVGAMLLVFIAIMAGANYILGDLIGARTGFNDVISNLTDGQYAKFSFEFIVGYICAPFVWLIGIPAQDMIYVGELLGQKTILNEFVAYTRLGELKTQGLISERSIIMATYILCGFANFSSIGIQVGGIGSLAPSKRGQIAKFGFRALIGGTVACLFTATIVGMLL